MVIFLKGVFLLPQQLSITLGVIIGMGKMENCYIVLLRHYASHQINHKSQSLKKMTWAGEYPPRWLAPRQVFAGSNAGEKNDFIM